MLDNKEDDLGDVRKISEAVYQQMKQQLGQAYRWYEIVRGFRAFYDHFRVAFSNLKQLPKYYTEDWAEQFKDTARNFVKTEDMTTVRKVLVGAGYGTEKWVEMAKLEAEDIARAIDQLMEKLDVASDTDNEEQLAQLQKRYEDLRQEYRDSQNEVKKKDEQVRTLNKRVKKLSSTLTKDEETQNPARKFAAPSAMGAQMREYEQELTEKDQMISSLSGQLEREQQALEEHKEDVRRERDRRRKFEEELEEDRQGLREHMQQLKVVLNGASELPAMEEFEEIDSDELLEYIGDVEQEKQRALAGLEAMDAQKESYQKQLEVQQGELGAIQDDLEKYRGTNLATEIERAKDTIDTQRVQLEALLNISKNLTVQMAQFKERQDPLRNLVERLNLQEKALIRFIRIKYDRSFMPNQAYEKEEN